MSDDAKKSISERYRTGSYARRVSTRAITIDDVARAAQVSPVTVSTCGELQARRADRPRARVRTAVAELGYQPFGPARALRRQATELRGRSSSPTSRTRSSPRWSAASRTSPTRARLPRGAVQLRRGPRQGGRVHRRRDPPSAWPASSSPSRRPSVTHRAAARRGHPGRRRRPPPRATRDIDSRARRQRAGRGRRRPHT